jgi:hypothetical protein
MPPHTPPVPSPPPAGAAPAPAASSCSAASASSAAASSRLDPFRLELSPRRRYRPRHDAAVVLAEIRRLRGAARARTSEMASRSELSSQTT